MVSTHISSRGLIWHLGGEDSNAKKDYVIVHIPPHMNCPQAQPIVNANNTTFIKHLIHFIKHILYIL